MFKPFSNDSDSLNINGDDKTGLTTALALQKAVNAIVDALQNDASLPTKLADEPPKPAGKTDNPFI